MKSLYVMMAAGALLLALAAVGISQQGPGRRGDGPPFGGPRERGGALGPLARDLNLTDAQKAQIKQLEDNFQTSTKDLRDQLEALRPEPFAATDATFDEAAVRAAAQKRAAIMVELEVAHARLMSQVFSVLTTEQKTKLNELRQQFEERRRQWEQQRAANQQANP